MKVQINNSTKTLITTKPAILQFSGPTLLTTDINDESFELQFDSNDTYEFRGGTNLYAESKSSSGEYIYFSDSATASVSGAIIQEVVDVDPTTIGDYYSFNIADKDFAIQRVSSNGQQFTEISMSPLTTPDSQTIIEYKKPFRLPMTAEIEASISQRIKGQYGVWEITDKDTSYVDVPTEYSIVSSYTDQFGTVQTTNQATTTLTIVLDSEFDGYLGSWVDIYGFADSRLNYTNLCVATMSIDKRVLTFIVSDEATIPSITTTPTVTGAKLKRQAKLLQAANAMGYRFSGTSNTAAVALGRFGGSSIKETGTLIGSKTITVGDTRPVYVSAANGQLELKATNRYSLEMDIDKVLFNDRSIDSVSSMYNVRAVFSAVKPDTNKDYYLRFRAVTPKSIARPVAKIVSIVRSVVSGAATVTTDVPHGLVDGNYVNLWGVKDQTNFANGAASYTVTVSNATQFTITWGSTAIATSYGGCVILQNGWVSQQGLVTQSIIAAERTSLGTVKLTGTANWFGVQIGEYVDVYGVRVDGTGADLGIDGAYMIANVSTTSLYLTPIRNIDGSLAVNGSGTQLTPTGGAITSTACGGVVILRTTMRSHDIEVGSYTQQITRIDGQGTNRVDKAIPVVTTSSGFGVTTTETTMISPSTYTLTTAATTNGASIKTTAGNLYAITVSNLSAATIYLKLYNKASAPTVGTDVPIIVIPIPANSTQILETGRVGIRFTTGIASAVTLLAADTDTSVITAGNKVVISYI